MKRAMQKEWTSLFIPLLLSVVLSQVCPVSAGASGDSDWQVATTVTGHYGQITGNFTIPTNEWRVTWNCTVQSWVQSTEFVFFMIPKGKGFVDVVASVFVQNEADPRSGVISRNDTTAQDYWLHITAESIENYSIRVEYKTNPPPGPSVTNLPYSLYAVLIVVTIAGVLLAAIAIMRRTRKV